jgi:hypothetical protein
MKRLVIESWFLLFRFGCMMRLSSFNELCQTVRKEEVDTGNSAQLASAEELCRAMNYACVLYFKRVLCLQRSAATTLLLRRHGFDAELVIGAKLLPFRSHAWVELKGRIANDRPYVKTIYQVLQRY